MRTATRIYTWVYLRPGAAGMGPTEIGSNTSSKRIFLAGLTWVKVMYADQYARLMFERKLHDQLPQDVMAAEVKAPALR